MNREDLIQLIAEKACGYLAHDAANPDVGFGMGYGEAIDYAEKDILQEAARWNSIAALQLEFTDNMRKSAYALIYEMRRGK